MNKSNISLSSNIMLKKRYIDDIKGRHYIPYHLLNKEEKNAAASIFLSQRQKEQQDKQLFTSYIFVNEEESIMLCDEGYLNKNEFYPENIREIKQISYNLDIKNVILLVDSTKKNFEQCLENLRNYITKYNLCDEKHIYIIPNRKYNSFFYDIEKLEQYKFNK